MAANNGIQELPTDTGAGVGIVETYRNKARSRTEIALILVETSVYDRNQGRHVLKWTLPGGKREAGDSIKKTARKELEEETANLIRLSENEMDSNFAVRHTNPFNGEGFVAYFVHLLGPLMSSHFYTNLQTLQTNGASHDYLEAGRICRVYLSDMVAQGVSTTKGDFQATDANGKSVLIEARTKAVIREALHAGFIPNLTPVKPNFNADFNRKNRGDLKHTACYWL